jgi:hypothetical protein
MNLQIRSHGPSICISIRDILVSLEKYGMQSRNNRKTCLTSNGMVVEKARGNRGGEQCINVSQHTSGVPVGASGDPISGLCVVVLWSRLVVPVHIMIHLWNSNMCYDIRGLS